MAIEKKKQKLNLQNQQNDCLWRSKQGVFRISANKHTAWLMAYQYSVCYKATDDDDD